MKTIFLAVFSFWAIGLFAGNEPVDKTRQAKEWLKNQPLAFIENKGQFTNSDGKPADNVLFKASYGSCDIYITTEGLSYVFVKYEEKQQKSRDTNDFRRMPGEKPAENKSVSYYRLDMNLQGSAINKTQIIKELPGKQGITNYFYPHCPDGIYGVQEYGKITIKNIYKGIDWVIYTNAENKEVPLKYDFVVQPQANYKDIKIKFVNAQSTSLADNGTKLKIQTIAGNIEEGNLYSYLQNSTAKQAIKTNYVANADSTVEFELGVYDKTKTLVIDPLVWATYYGGYYNDALYSMCTDSEDNIYLAGTSYSTNFPAQQLTGAYWQPIKQGDGNAIIIKFNSSGVRKWSTFYGGNMLEDARSICTDNQDNIYITGLTYSADFPAQQLAGAFNQSNNAGYVDSFILKFNNTGVRQWATHYGGSESEGSSSICVDSQNNIFIAGQTNSNDLPLKQLAGAYNQATYAGVLDAFLIKFSAQGELLWATYYGGNNFDFGWALIAGIYDNIYLTGFTGSFDFPHQSVAGEYHQTAFGGGTYDAFILKFNNQGARQWATYYGGSDIDYGFALCTDNENNIYVTGSTLSTDFPIQLRTGAFNQSIPTAGEDAFVLKFNDQGIRQWATYLGGDIDDCGWSICSDKKNNIYLTGYTRSENFPVLELKGEYFQETHGGGQDVFILKFNNLGILKWSTYYGGDGYDVATTLKIDNQNSAYLCGWVGRGAYTQDYGNGAYFDDSYNESMDGLMLKIELCNIQKPTSVLSDRNNLCINETGNIILTAIGGMGDTLKWYSDNLGLNYIGKGAPLIIPAPTKTTAYYARWESLCDTSDCDSIKVFIIPPISINRDHSICTGETYTVGISNYTTAGIYTDILKSISGCDSTVITNLTVNPTFLTPPQSHSICEGETFTVGTNDYSTTGNYIDVLKTSLGCDSTVTTIITVNPLPEVSLGDDQLLCPGDTITLSPGTGFTSYLWSDGSILNNMVATSPGIYAVTAYNEWCPASDEITITGCGSELRFPNAFSPNNDYTNETFKPVILGTLTAYHIIIYNRWGQQLYESNDVSTGWNGTFKGGDCATGQYVYVATYSMGAEPSTQKQRVQRGAFTLLR